MRGPARIHLRIVGLARCTAQALLFAKLWEPGLGRELGGDPGRTASQAARRRGRELGAGRISRLSQVGAAARLGWVPATEERGVASLAGRASPRFLLDKGTRQSLSNSGRTRPDIRDFPLRVRGGLRWRRSYGRL